MDFYVMPGIACPDCQVECPPPYLQVAYNRDGKIYIQAWCDSCKSKVGITYDVLWLMVRAQERDGYEPTKH